MQECVVAKGLVKRFGNKIAVNGIDLTLYAGEVFGLLGPNGAGKTTTVGMLTGLLRPDAGCISVCGHNLSSEPLEVKRVIGYVPDDPFLYDKLTGREFVTLLAELYSVSGSVHSKVDDLLHRFGLEEVADAQIGSYSRGMREKTALCGQLVHDPQVLYLDEPTVGLDPRSARLLKDILRDMADEGKTVLICTHILEMAQGICDRVAIIDRGNIVAQGSLEELREAARAGEDATLEDVFLRLTQEA